MPAPTWVIDLDGVVWLSGRAIGGASDAVDRLRRGGRRVLFATNNADPTVAQLLARLHGVGIDASPEEIVTSAQASATMVPAASRVLACGGEGLLEALGAAGIDAVDAAGPPDDRPVDTVIVGMTRAFDYVMLSRAALAVRAGATLIGTNEDPTHPTPEGLLPGSGALVAAVATAAQHEARFAGKPHAPMVSILRSRTDPDGIAMVVGDRPATDGVLARRLGSPFGLVLSGVTAAGHGPLDVEPDDEAADLAELVSRHL